MLTLKPLSRTAVPSALVKAERYRLLNEPGEAASICRDVLQVEPDHEEALIMLVLALTDQFHGDGGSRLAAEARGVLTHIADPYSRLYFDGIIRERHAKSVHAAGRSGWNAAVHEGLRDALSCYERAEDIRPAGNDDAILRWNACARLLMELPPIEPDVLDRRSVENE